MTVHATGDYIVTASLDRTWAFYDVQAQICLTQVSPEAIYGLRYLGFQGVLGIRQHRSVVAPTLPKGCWRPAHSSVPAETPVFLGSLGALSILLATPCPTLCSILLGKQVGVGH